MLQLINLTRVIDTKAISKNEVSQKELERNIIFLKIILALIAIFFAFISFSQDRIYTHKNEVVNCQVTEIGNKTIKYHYQNEDVINSISKNLVSQIEFASGRVQRVTDKVVITSENDWEKVIITNEVTDIEGLSRVSEMMGKATGFFSGSQGKQEQRVIIKLKKEAASKGAHIILILTKSGQNASFFRDAKASVIGIAYKY